MTENDILTALKTLAGIDQQVYEIVVDGNKAKTFKDLESAAAFAYKASQKPTTRAVYFVFNPIDAEALSAYIKAEKAKGRKAPRTCDAVIVRRRWIVFDFDPARPKDVNSTDAEKAKALEVADQVKSYLADYLWSAPIEIDSGNGLHLYYPADIDNSPESRRAVKGLLEFVSAKFSTDGAIVDQTVFKAGQLMRLPGTMNRKGDNLEDRPHRGVTILSEPEEAQEPIRLQDIIEIIGELETESFSTEAPEDIDNEAEGRLDVDAYANSTGLELLQVDPIDRISPEGKGFTVYPVICPFDPSHAKGEAALTVGTNGAIGFGCKHHSCADHDWEDLKELLGSPTVEHYPQPRAEDEFDAIEIPEGPRGKWPTIFFASDNSAVESEFPARAEVVCGLMQLGDVSNIVAAPKVGKSWLSIGLGVSVARGEPWLGFPTRKGRVLIVDNELKPSDFIKRLKEVARAMGVERDELDDLRHVHFRGRLVDLNRLRVFFEDTVAKGEYQLIVLDALYRFLPPRVSENDNGDMTRLYNTIDSIAESTGAAIACVHHTSKGGQWGKSITDIGSGAGAISRCVDSHLTLRAHEIADHAVVDCEVRNFAPIDQFSIQWTWPLWTRSGEVPIVAVPKSRGESRSKIKDQEDLNKIASLLDEGPKTSYEIRKAMGWGAQKTDRLIVAGRDNKTFTVEMVKGQKDTDQYKVSAMKVTDFENV